MTSRSDRDAKNVDASDDEGLDGVYLHEPEPDTEETLVVRYSTLYVNPNMDYAASEFSSTQAASSITNNARARSSEYRQRNDMFTPSHKSLVPAYPIESEENMVDQDEAARRRPSSALSDDEFLGDVNDVQEPPSLPGISLNNTDAEHQQKTPRKPFGILTPVNMLRDFLCSNISLENGNPKPVLSPNKLSPTYSMVSFYPIFGRRPQVFPFKYIPSILGEPKASSSSAPQTLTSIPEAIISPVPALPRSVDSPPFTELQKEELVLENVRRKDTPWPPNRVANASSTTVSSKPNIFLKLGNVQLENASVMQNSTKIQKDESPLESTIPERSSPAFLHPKYSPSDEVSIVESKGPSRQRSISLSTNYDTEESSATIPLEPENEAVMSSSILEKLEIQHPEVEVNVIREDAFGSKLPQTNLSMGIPGVKRLLEVQSKVKLNAEVQMDFLDYFAQKDGYVYIGMLESYFVTYYEKTQALIRSKEFITPGSREISEEVRTVICQIYEIEQVKEEKELQDYDFPAALERDSRFFEIDYMPKLHNYGVQMILHHIKLLLLKKSITPISIYTFSVELLADIVILCYGIFTKIGEFLTQLIADPSDDQLHRFTLESLITALRNLVASICDEIGAIGQSCSQILIRVSNLEREEVFETLTSIYKQVHCANISVSRAMEAIAPAIHFYYVKYFL